MGVLIVDFSKVGKNPLNPLGLALRKLVWESLDKAEQDPQITSIILTGGGANFSAGADLTEFGSLMAKGGADDGNGKGFFPLPALVMKIENCSKPVVAAISGNALGGGLEVALSCHYRITDTRGKFALPEVHVGVIPGAGGTQRLPRLVGVAKALDMILSGKTIKADAAKKLGLVDHVAASSSQAELLDVAKQWAEWAALMPLEDRRVGKLALKEKPSHLEQIFAATRMKLPAKDMGGEGVHAAFEAVKACALPIEEGQQVELEQFFVTLTGQQGKARRHVFFATRNAQKPLGKPPANHPLLKKSFQGISVGVIGAGLMGSGIAMVLLQAGFEVQLVDISEPALQKGVAFLQGTVKAYVKRGKLPEKKASQMLKSLKPTTRMTDLSTCVLVVEAVVEKMVIKKKIFAQLDKITPQGCILLSNTSTLDMDEMASALSEVRRPLFGGWHFFSPAHIMKLVEIITGKATSLETISILQSVTRRIGKTGVVVGNCDGFVGNRLLISYGAESALLLEEGAAKVASLDRALVNFGMPMGPLQMGDMAGLDIGYFSRKQRGWVSENGKPGPNRPPRYTDIGDIIVVDYKRLGQKNGKGWYDYDKKVGRGRKPLFSQEVDDLLQKHIKTPSVPFTESQIVERIVFPLVNEGFKVLEEGIANQPSDIDVVYIYGYGWPAYKGGPMFWADHIVGLKYLLSRLEDFAKQFPDTPYFEPSALLRTCVAMDITVEKYYKLGLHKRSPKAKL